MRMKSLQFVDMRDTFNFISTFFQSSGVVMMKRNRRQCLVQYVHVLYFKLIDKSYEG